MSKLLKKIMFLVPCFALLFGPVHAVSYLMPGVARPSVTMGRMPTIGGGYRPGTGPVVPGTGTTTLTEQELINLYVECLKGEDVCGVNFEECTTKSLFYGKKAQCAGQQILLPANALNVLYGVNSSLKLGERSITEKDENGDFVLLYPAAGSLLDSVIQGAVANNRLSTQDCVRSYQKCIAKEDVCGPEFALCTGDKEFKKQKILCGSILARCGDDGKKELFGTTDTTGNPTDASRLGILIKEGGDLAAVNAVASCYKVADACMLSACASNPYKCKEGTDPAKYCAAAILISPETGDAYCADGSDVLSVAINRSSISGFIKNECFDTISSNKYCYATVMEKMPTAAELKNEDNKSEVFSTLFNNRFNDGMRTKISEMAEKFDRKTSLKCQETIVSCAMKSCGGGSGAACYASAFDATVNSKLQGVTSKAAKQEIKFGCEHIVNNDLSCKYIAATFTPTTGSWDFEDNSIFDVLFTKSDDTTAKKPDVTGAVAELNSSLSLSYSEGALDEMRIDCQAVAQSCVKSMCGPEYVNCYRNRTDITSSVGSMPGNDQRSNQAGGVLDSSIVIGLCVNTIKDNATCAEHMRSEIARAKAGNNQTNLWGAGKNGNMWGHGVSNAWVAGGANTFAQQKVQARDYEDYVLCLPAVGSTDYGRCEDASGKYTVPYMVTSDMYANVRSIDQIFSSLIRNMELEAQAIYKAKVTKQQNMCFAGNSGGGIMGNRDLGGTFLWARLTGKGVPNNYGTNGLETKQFKASNDLYGSFCRIKVEIKSSNDDILNAVFRGSGKAYMHGKETGVPDLSAYTTRYFAAGDAFTCGSWIPETELGAVSQTIADAKYNSKGNARTRNWATVAASVLGAGGGAVGMNALQNNGLGGLLGTTQKITNEDVNIKMNLVQGCINESDSQLDFIRRQNNSVQFIKAKSARATTGKFEWDIFILASNESTDNQKQKHDISQALSGTESEKSRCQNEYYRLQSENKDGETVTTNQSKKNWINAGGATVGAAGAGILTYQAIKSGQKASAEGEAAVWMTDVGNHIKCYIGSEEVGSFGDIISTEME